MSSQFPNQLKSQLPNASSPVLKPAMVNGGGFKKGIKEGGRNNKVASEGVRGTVPRQASPPTCMARLLLPINRTPMNSF